MSSFPFVAFAGSRSLPSSARSLVQAVVRSAISAGKGVSTGCAWGADAFARDAAARFAPRGHVQVFSAWPQQCQQGKVSECLRSSQCLCHLPAASILCSQRSCPSFSACGPAVRGACEQFNLIPCHRAEHLISLQSSGVSVHWLAGGGLSRPVVERLKARSKLMVSSASQSGQGAGLVMFVTGGWQQSPGSWFTAVHAIKSGLPVVVFPVSCSVQCFPSLGQGGQWQVAGSGVWAQGFRWVA